jgi:hypothetical protein
LTVLELASGGSCVLLDHDGEHVVVLSSLSRPPGSTLEATFGGRSLRIKVRGCRRVEPDAEARAYRIEGRFVSLTRELREALLPAR